MTVFDHKQREHQYWICCRLFSLGGKMHGTFGKRRYYLRLKCWIARAQFSHTLKTIIVKGPMHSFPSLNYQKLI